MSTTTQRAYYSSFFTIRQDVKGWPRLWKEMGTTFPTGRRDSLLGDIPVEESGNVLRRVLQEPLLQQEFNALFRVHVEFLPSEGHLLSSGCIFTAIKKETRQGVENRIKTSIPPSLSNEFPFLLQQPARTTPKVNGNSNNNKSRLDSGRQTLTSSSIR